MTDDGPVYVYGVIRSDARISPPTDGVAGAATRVIASDGLAAVVSSVQGERLRVRRRDLLAHLRSLEQVFEQTTVVPCSFGTVLPSEHEVRDDLLASRSAELHELLDRLADRIQLNVKAAYDESEVLQQLVAAVPELGRARERAARLGEAAYYENIRLGELVAAALAERRHVDAQRIDASLAPLAAQVVAEPPTDELLVLKASYLIDRKRLEAFDLELESLAGNEGPTIRFESFGPLPPTAFVALGEGD
jgi:hypothetical protein